MKEGTISETYDHVLLNQSYLSRQFLASCSSTNNSNKRHTNHFLSNNFHLDVMLKIIEQEARKVAELYQGSYFNALKQTHQHEFEQAFWKMMLEQNKGHFLNRFLYDLSVHVYLTLLLNNTCLSFQIHFFLV